VPRLKQNERRSTNSALIYTNGSSAGEKGNTSRKVVKTKSLKIKAVFPNHSSTELLQGFRQESLN
jgi:hypothetical protein